MVLRLILVGLVAGLGLSLPTRRDMDTMARSAQHWMNDRLADWDPQTASGRGSSVFVVEPAGTTLASAPRAPVSHRVFADVLGEAVALSAQDEPAGKAREPEQLVKGRDEIAVSETSKALAIDLPTEPVLLSADESIMTGLAFDPPSEETAEDLTVDVAVLEESTSRDLAFEGVLDETVISFALDASTLAKADETPNRGPLEIDENLYAGEAYALNRVSDGVQVSVPARDETGKNENPLTNAVRLTREAVVAWASLLHGPAVVTIAP
jgi:hypothetical protein